MSIRFYGDESDYNRATSKRMLNEAKRLLLDKKYEELRMPTDKDYEYAWKIAIILFYGGGPEKAVNTTELTITLFPELDKYEEKVEGGLCRIPEEVIAPKEVQVIRSINLLKKMALDGLVKAFEKDYEDPNAEDSKLHDVPFYICSEYSEELESEVYYDALPRIWDQKIREERLRQFFKTLGFDTTHLDKPGIFELTSKGAGMIRHVDNMPEKFKQLQEKLDRENVPFPPEYDMQETDDILDNLKGDYTSDSGLYELLELVEKAREMIGGKAREDHYTTTKLMHDLMPASRTATGAELEMYKTKMSDIEYVLHRSLNPSQKYLDAQREDYKRNRRFKTIKYINNSYPKEENKIGIIEVTYDKSTADKFVVSFFTAVITKFPRIVKAHNPGEKPFTADYMTLEQFKCAAQIENYNLFKEESNYIEYRKYEPEDKYGAHDINILSAPITQNNTILEYTDKIITADAQNVRLPLKEFEEVYIQSQGYVRMN